MDLNNVTFDWILDSPKHWKKERVKNHFILTKNKCENPEGYPILSLTMRGIIERDITSNEGQLPDTYNGYTLLKRNDIVFNPMDLISGWVDSSNYEGLISPSYKVLRPNSNNVDIKFYTYYFQIHYKEKIFFHFGEGVHYEYRWGLGTETLKNFPILVPPISEQQQIVEFLDTKTELIDSLIEKTERKIELLKEKRTSLINETVTKGLNPNVEMKDSGVEWIREIPSHYQIISIKFLVTTPITDGPHETPVFVDEGIPFLSVNGVVGNKINFKKVRGYITEELHIEYSKKCKPQRDDVLLVKSGSTTGKSTIVETDLDFNIWSPLCIIRSNTNKIIPRFTFHTFQSGYFRVLIEDNWSYGTQPNIGMNVIENLSIVVPPISEQKEIVEYLDEQTGLIDKTISNEEKRIELLKEYRQSLISEVVTGKRKVTN